MKTTLYIANKNYSSWSMRAWLAARFVGLEFNEVIIPLREENTTKEISKISFSKKVPCLHIKGLQLWDSLAIAEYLNELFLDKKLFSTDQNIRAIQRAIVCEMHSGFMDLRKEMPMNMKIVKQKIPSEACQANIDRILEIWRETRKRYAGSGKFLFGNFSLADIFFAPIVSRFISYKVDTKDQADYIANISTSPLYQEWLRGAKEESWVIKDFEVEIA